MASRPHVSGAGRLRNRIIILVLGVSRFEVCIVLRIVGDYCGLRDEPNATLHGVGARNWTYCKAAERAPRLLSQPDSVVASTWLAHC
jgi:hypothetical protein